ncbi:MAG TPA: DUF1905 domain-containing protein [Saprospiraceae bacterium]|nr:DUF1905 domain-containing protein [Saprospiraceae bacterium]
MSEDTPIVSKAYQLQRFCGKGGWTYALIPEIKPDSSNPFGWVVVKGLIDDCQLSQVKLMPMGNGQLFLPVKAEIRRKIHKNAGDIVFIELYMDDSAIHIPDEILECFKEEPESVLNTFLSFTAGQQKSYLDWIQAAKREETRVGRIATMIERVSMGLTLTGKV